MQAALHQYASASKFLGLANLVVDGLEFKDISLFGLRALQRAIESAESAILGAEVCVVNVAIDDVGDHALGVALAAQPVGFHANPDQVIGAVEFEGLLFGQGHVDTSILTEPRS